MFEEYLIIYDGIFESAELLIFIYYERILIIISTLRIKNTR